MVCTREVPSKTIFAGKQTSDKQDGGNGHCILTAGIRAGCKGTRETIQLYTLAQSKSKKHHFYYCSTLQMHIKQEWTDG